MPLSLFLVHTYHKSSRLHPVFCGSVRERSCVPLGKSLTPQFLGSTFIRWDTTTWILRGVDEMMYVQCWGQHQAVSKQLIQDSYHHPHHHYDLKRWKWTLRRKGQRQKTLDRRDGKRDERLTVAACWFLGTAPNISRQTEHSVAGEVHGTSTASAESPEHCLGALGMGRSASVWYILGLWRQRLLCVHKLKVSEFSPKFSHSLEESAAHIFLLLSVYVSVSFTSQIAKVTTVPQLFFSIFPLAQVRHTVGLQ